MIEIASAIAAFKAVKDLGKTVVDAKIDADVQAKVFEVMGKIGDAQDTMYELREENMRLQAEKAELSRQLADDEEWKDKLSGYELVKTLGGAVVFKSKIEPEHYVCPSCTNHKRIEILQDERSFSGHYRCTAKSCGAEFPVKPSQSMETLERRGSPWAR